LVYNFEMGLGKVAKEGAPAIRTSISLSPSISAKAMEEEATSSKGVPVISVNTCPFMKASGKESRKNKV